MKLPLEQKDRIEALLEKLKARASTPHVVDYQGDNFCAIDAGSYDDAFDWGCQVGEIDQARYICDILEIPYSVDTEW
jgi:hypothetical protein